VQAISDSELAQLALRGEVALFGSSSPGASVLELPGILASVVPATPERSLFNAVVYERGEDLRAAWHELAQRYGEAGVQAWTVWRKPDDEETSSELARRGHCLDGRPVAMVAALDSMTLVPEDALAWSSEPDVESVGRINDVAYSWETPAFRAVLGAGTAAACRTYVARVAGRAVCCLVAHDEPHGVLGVTAVATLPEARGQRLASRLLSGALREAKGRGLTHTALVASSAGRGVYARLGYRDAGVRELWENRRR
jgi:GNAT superfamily N-acetyltransferase